MTHSILDSPCIFCGYCAAGYYQSGTHKESCPWHTIGGLQERYDQFRRVIKSRIAELGADNDQLRRDLTDARNELEKSRSVIDNALEDWRKLREWIEARIDSPAGVRLVAAVIEYAERAEKVTDAAVAVDIAGSARIKVGALLSGGLAHLEAVRLLFDAQLQGMSAMADAVREYRARVEGEKQ